MPSRRHLLQGCLLAGISLGMGAPVLAQGASIQWTATWSVREAEDGLLVRLTVRPSRDTRLQVTEGEGGSDSQTSGPLSATVAGEPRLVQVTTEEPLARAMLRRRSVELKAGEEFVLGPWKADVRPSEDATLSVTLDGEESVTLTHQTAKPTFAVVWEANRIGRSSASVFVSLTPDRDVVLRLHRGQPKQFRVLAGGRRTDDGRPVSRGMARPELVPLAKGETRKVGGWLVQASEPTLSLEATVEHDRGQTVLKADVPVTASGS